MLGGDTQQSTDIIDMHAVNWTVIEQLCAIKFF